MMRHLYLIAIALILRTVALAQCPPPGFPQPGNSCPQAPILCENLDGYCATINNANTPQTFPGCPGWQLNNDEWFAFFAGSTSITIQVTPTDCSPGNNQGLQGGIYAGCGPPWVAMDLQCSCTENPFILQANNFVIGQIYYFVLDGCAGNVCDYSIDVLSGSTVGVPPANPGTVTGNVMPCAGTTSTYTLPPVPAGTIYTWSITPSGLGTINSNNNNVTVTWGNNASGPAQICVTVANACYTNSNPSCIDVDIIPKPTATISGGGVLCPGATTPIDLTVSFTGDGPWKFIYTRNNVAQPLITTSENPYILQVTQPGTYVLQSVATVTGNCNGTVSGSAVVTASNLNVTATSVNTQCGLSNGSINASPTGGSTPYVFSWSSGESTEDLANISAGTYTLTVTDNIGCTKTVEVTVTDHPITFSVSAAIQANTTCNGGNGSIDVSVSPTTNTYTYEWSNGPTTQDQSNLEPGTYTVTVSAGGTCTSSAEFTVPDQPNAPNLTATFVQTTCDLSNGSINLSVSGGVTPYSFQWSGGQNTEDISNIPADTYTVTVTGGNGCTSSAEITVTNNNPPFSINGNVISNTTCLATGNGSITISVSPANPNYTYTWSTNAGTQNINNLLGGTYTVTVSAGGSCIETAEFTVEDDPNEPTPNLTPHESSCDLPNGSINLSVSGGVGPYTYLWSTGANTQNINNLAAGDYTVTVTGANGCTGTAETSVVNENPSININANIVSNTTCNGNGNGSISLTVTPAGTYTYAWSPAGSTPNLNNLNGGTYTVTVSAGGSCTETAEFTVDDDPNVPNISGIEHESTCDLSNGWINLSVSGGVGPYTYLWSTGANTQNLTNVPAGGYEVTVTGANGCTNTAEFTINNENPPITINGVTQPNTSCNGNGNGSISVTASPTGTYTYVWSTGSNAQTINNLPSGTYTVTVTLSGSCVEFAEFTVDDEPNEPNVSGIEHPSTCDLSNGWIDVSVNGGVAPYTYLWSTGGNTQDLNNQPSGLYFVTVTGANGCTTVMDFFIDNDNPPIYVDAIILPNTKCTGGNGSINVSVSPTANYTYLWSTGVQTQDLSNLEGGPYVLTVTLSGSCTAEAVFEVPDEPNLPNLVLNTNPSSCGLSNGSIDLSVSGSTTPYTYLWSTNATTQDLNNIPTETYFVTVTGSNGCTNTDFVTVPEETIDVTVSGVVLPDNSCVSNNGRITLTIDPPNATISWSGGGSGPVLNNLAAGTYSVTVSAGGNCTETASFTVQDQTAPPTLSTDVTAATCGLPNGAIDLQVSGGILPYTYNWSTNTNTQDLTNLPPGPYTVTVTTAAGCSAVSAANVSSNAYNFSITGAITDNTSCTTPNGAIAATVTPANTYTYLWSTTAPTSGISGLAPGNYTVTVTFGVNCTNTAVFNVPNSATAPNLAASSVPATCNLPNGTAAANPSGGMAPYTFLWSNTAMTNQVPNLAPGTYSVTVTGANGCTSNASVNVPNNDIALNVTASITENTSCTSGNGAINVSVAPAGSYTYTWSNSSNAEDLANLNTGTYTVVVSAGGTCTASAQFAVASNTEDPVLSPAITPAICGNNNGAINMSISGAIPPYTFAWSNNANTEDLNNILPGNYTVTVTGANGCTSDTTLNVPNNSNTFSLSGTASALTRCDVPNGAINLVITPAAGSYGVSWSNSANTEDIGGLVSGIYTVSVTDLVNAGCTASASFIVADDRTYPSAASSVVPDLCNLQIGAIALDVTGGTKPYTYLWSGGQKTPDVSNLAGGVYTVTVTGANGCTTTASANVPENAISFSLSGVTTTNTTCGTNTGGINLSVNPVVPPAGPGYSFVWSNGVKTEDLSAITGGIYTVTVSAGGSCTNVASFTVDDSTLSPSIGETLTPASCGKSNGGIDLSVGGGVAPYTYKWSNASTNEDLSGISAGNYTVTVNGANGCTSVKSFVVPDDVILPGISGIVIPNTSCVASNGGVSIDIAPAGTYTFKWSGGQTQQNIANLAAGTYTVTVSGGGGCVASATFSVPNNAAAVLVSGVQTDILCFGNKSGAIDLSVNGGVPPFQFKWAPAISGNPPSPQNLAAGTYAVTVTDAAGCSSTASFILTQPASSVSVSCATTHLVSFPGANDGAGQVTIGGGIAPYTITWTGGPAVTAPAGVYAFDKLDVATYDLTVTDANGCTAVCGFSVNLITCNTVVGTMSGNLLSKCGPGCLTANYNAAGQFLEPGDVLQFILHQGNSNKIVNELARSSQPTFCFDPSIMTYGTTYYVSAAAGNSDINGNVLLNDYCTVVATGTPIRFDEKPDAAIVLPGIISCVQSQVPLFGSSSIANSTFKWSTNTGLIGGNTSQASVNALAGGLYTLIVNANGCADTAAVQVKDVRNAPKATILANPSDILDCAISEIILAGTAEGTTNANTIWLYNGQPYTGANPVPITTPGVYTFVVLDTVSLCSDTASITISENLSYPPLFINPPGMLTCKNSAITLSGGSSFPGIQLSWAKLSGPDTVHIGSGANVTVAAPGTYLLLGLDPVNGCKNQLAGTVTADLAAPVANAGPAFSLACFGESGVLDGSGSTGEPGLQFLWTTNDGHFANGQISSTPKVDEPGTYQLLVTNPGNGCTDTDQVVIAPEEPVATLRIVQPPCVGDKGTIVIEKVTGGKPPVRYSIDNGVHFTGNNVFNQLQPGTYTILAQDANGCTTTAQAIVEQPDVVEITLVPEVYLGLGDTYDIKATVSISDDKIASIKWVPATGLSCDDCLEPTLSALNSGRYVLTVVSKAGCKDSAPLLVVVDKNVDVYVPNIFSPDDDGVNDILTVYADPKAVTNIKAFQVYSRWGELVYEDYNFTPNDPNRGWNGKHRGNAMTPAVFVWHVEVDVKDGRTLSLKGDVTLKR